MNILWSFTIGPVKAFIENARKSRDMFAGSRLLSETMAVAIDWLQNTQHTGLEIRIIFPHIEAEQQSLSIPNRLIATFPDAPDGQLKQIADDLTTYLRQHFTNNCLHILEAAGIQPAGLKLAQNQLKDFLEVYWLYERYADGEYTAAYRHLTAELNAVKSIRSFEQANEPWGRKCALFPEYNAIFAYQTNSAYPHFVNSSHVYDLSDHPLIPTNIIKPTEALSAIALVKRLYDKGLPKITSLRLMMLQCRLTFDAREYLHNTPDHIANIIYDHANGLPLSDYTTEATETALALYQKIIDHNIVLSDYYALVKFDGDSMGDHFNRLDQRAQADLSKKLSQFALQVPDIIEAHQGLPVFAGGEDFFGFLPLDTLFNALAELHDQFGASTGLTFSAGIAIAHLMQPLKDVVAEAEHQENIAKSMPGKNAFAIGILKRSGEALQVPPYHLSPLDGASYLKDVTKLINRLTICGCPKSLIYHIGQLLEPFSSESDCLETPIVKPLLRQLITSSSIGSDEELLQDMLILYQDHTVREFINTLNAASFIAREVISVVHR